MKAVDAERSGPLGFVLDGEEPCLTVRLDGAFSHGPLPTRFDGVRVRVHESEAGKLAVGRAQISADS